MKKNKFLAWGLIVLMLTGGLVLASCGVDDSDPVAVANAFIAAARKGDVKAMEKLATEWYVEENIRSDADFGNVAKEAMKEMGKSTVTEVNNYGDECEVIFSFEYRKKDVDLDLIKENGKWRVSGF